MERTLANDTPRKIGKTVRLAGWIGAKRDHGQLLFIDLKDRSGVVQLVASGAGGQAIGHLPVRSCVEIYGQVKQRPANMRNPKLKTGEVEVTLTQDFTVYSRARALPFELHDTRSVGEEHRLRFRYLDLENARMRQNLTRRASLIHALSAAATGYGFLEVETPYLGKSTPEGARDYLVPARIMPGNFYALPQSPQQYKQLLMVSGIERYFQIVRCFRDEDTRADRQPEFTQFDLELSFTDEAEIMGLVETILQGVITKLWPEKKLSPFTQLGYDEAIKTHRSDHPDLRPDPTDQAELAFVWITDFPAFERAEDQTLRAVHHPFTEVIGDPPFTGKEKARQYDLVVNGVELGGGSIRIHEIDRLRQVFTYLGYSEMAIEANFGHLLEAFSFGVPPHGGIALGIDRLLMVLQNEPSIREVIAFPKTADGRDLLMAAPSPVHKAQLDELGLSIKKRRGRDG